MWLGLEEKGMLRCLHPQPSLIVKEWSSKTLFVNKYLRWDTRI